MTPPEDESQLKRPADTAGATGAGDDLRPASRDEVVAANALNERIERKRAGLRPNSGPLSADEARAQVMAAGLRAAAPGAAEPDPDFVARLRQRLLDPAAAQQAVVLNGRHEPREQHERRRPAPSGVSRRAILAGGLGVAAAAAAGVAVGVGVEHAMDAPQPRPALVPAGRGAWLPVASVDALAVGQVLRFTANSVVGFVRRTNEGFVALSGSCTHMGCFLDWKSTARTYDCPCHGGRFSEDGSSAPSSIVAYQPLPKLETRVEQGKVWVYVPSSPSSPDGRDTPLETPYAE
jgi:Rieske Fe-S protein